jgi:hypothetical protein
LDKPENVPTGTAATSQKLKRAWQAPTLEEIDYTATEVVSIPGSTIDGGFPYSIP